MSQDLAVQDYFTQANKVGFESYNIDFAETYNKRHVCYESNLI